MNSIKEISNVIKSRENFSILVHSSVDGDCLGASIALATAIDKFGKKAVIFIDSALPEYFDFLPNKNFLVDEKDIYATMDTCITLDCGDTLRFKDRSIYFDDAELTINLDHHRTNTLFADYNYVEPECSSTCEIIFKLIKELGCDIDLDIANALYIGIASDTGRFLYSSTGASTHLAAAELINYGVDVGKLSERIFMYSTFKELKIRGKALTNLQLYADDRIAVTFISYEDINEIDALGNDLEGLADFGREISSVKISIAAKEVEPKRVRFSIRSKGDYNVASLAETFQGGGHINASGCTVLDTLENAVQKVLSEAKKIV